MAESNVIKEFLVSLGFKQDEASLKKFANGIETATKSVIGLATAIEATAVTVAAGVAKWASNLEALYFASMRTGVAAGALKAFDRAAQSFGTSAGEALSSIEGLARYMRNTPGGEGVINSWLMGAGLSTHDANGKLKDTAQILVEIGKFFADQKAQGQGFLSPQLASQWGIDERTMLAIQDPGFGAKLAEEQKKFANLDGITKRAHKFSIAMRDLGDSIERLGFKIEDALQQRLGISIKSITAWLDQNGDKITTTIVDGLEKLFDIAEKLKPAIQWVYDKFVELDKSTDGWSTKLIVAAAALKMIGGTEILTGLVGLTLAFARLATSAAGAAGAMSGSVAVATLAAGAGLGWAIQKYVPGWADFFGSIGSKLFDYTHKADAAVARWVNRGLTPAQAAGVVSNEQAESNFHANAVGDHGTAYGLFQWHKDRQDAFAKWAGHDIHGSTEQEQEEFALFEMKRMGVLDAMKNFRNDPTGSGALFSRMFEKPAAADAEAARRGANAAQIYNNVTVHIDGARSPEETGRAVTQSLEGVFRNGLGATR